MGGVAATDMNPWVSIWRQPRATIQHIVETDPERQVVMLAALAGIVNAFENAMSRDLGDRTTLVAILAMIAIAGPIFGVIGVYLSAVLLKWTGRWIGGGASVVTLRSAVAWGGVPLIVGGTLLVPAVLIAGEELFTKETPWLDQHVAAAVAVLVIALAQVVTGLWTFVVSLKTIGQVQGFSAWRALGNCLLAGLVIVVPIFVIVIGVAVLGR